MTQLLSVRVGSLPSTSLSTGAPQGCVVLLDSLDTYDCVATSHNTSIFKFADDTVVVGLISHNVEKAFLEEIRNLQNNLLLNIRKTKELIVDFSTKQVRNYYHQWRE